jgi:hypothetical protein
MLAYVLALYHSLMACRQLGSKCVAPRDTFYPKTRLLRVYAGSNGG